MASALLMLAVGAAALLLAWLALGWNWSARSSFVSNQTPTANRKEIRRIEIEYGQKSDSDPNRRVD